MTAYDFEEKKTTTTTNIVDHIAADSFRDALYSNSVKYKMNDLENLKDGYSVDQLLSKLNDIVITAADMSFRKRIRKQ